MTIDRSYADILADLVGFDSVSSNSNLDIAEYIETALDESGFTVRRIPSETGDKTSLLATAGKGKEPGVVLSAHTDVVPANAQEWTTPPFAVTLTDGRAYGRGTTDMKGFIAVVLAHAEELARAATRTPVHLAFSYDEEIGCRGAPDLVEATLDLPARPALCIVGEPTMMRMVAAHKGKVAKRVTFKGRAAHSASPQEGTSALQYAAEFVTRLQAIARGLSSETRDAHFKPPYSTLHIGSFHSGDALNIIPALAAVEFELRYISNAERDAIVDEIAEQIENLADQMKNEAPECGIETELMATYPALEREAGCDGSRIMRQLIAHDGPPHSVSFGTEAGLFSQAGIPTIVCGPGDMKRAHRANEWVGIDELAQAGDMLRRLASKLQKPVAEW